MGTMISIVASCSCRLCGEPYNVLSTGAQRGHDGLCFLCHVDDSPMYVGSVGTQVAADLAALGWFASGSGEAWDAQAFKVWQTSVSELEYSKQFRPPRMPLVSTIETRTCPVCGDPFDVAVPSHGGHNRRHCCDKHRKLDWWRTRNSVADVATSVVD